MLEGARMNPRIRYAYTILQMMALFVVIGRVQIFSFHGGGALQRIIVLMCVVLPVEH